jgi:16S rRNA (guanine527-N7)-methyltransferase
MTGERTKEEVGAALRKAGYGALPSGAREKLEGYIGEVSVWSERMHLVGRSRLGGNLALLVLDSLLLLRTAEESALPLHRVADVGSGAGFPGVVWKILRPDLEMTLFERRLKPALFLERIVTLAGLEGAKVVGGDASSWREPGSFDLVVSKAAGRLATILPLAELLLRTDGAYITIKGRGWKSEIPEPPQAAMRFEAAVNLPEKRGTAILFRKRPAA